MRTQRFIVLLFLMFAGIQRSPAGTLVQFHFFAGTSFPLQELDVELYDQDKPVTVSNFVRLVQSGAYQNSFFHRCQPGFVLQGGGFGVFNPPGTNILSPPYTNLIFPVFNFGPITNEFNVGKFYSNTNGTIAMAKSSDPNSANSQFFFNLNDNSSSLDQITNSGGFTVFGHVVRNIGLLSLFNTLGYGDDLFNLVTNYGTNTPLTAVFNQLPANFTNTGAPPLDDLFYFNVNVLTLHASVDPTSRAPMISWTTVAGVTNNLEFATNFPPVWQVLYSDTSANGFPIAVIDTSPNVTRRYYRLHILF